MPYSRSISGGFANRGANRNLAVRREPCNERNATHYKRLRLLWPWANKLGDRPVLAAVGNFDLVHSRLLALFCSIRCPGDVIVQTYDLVRALRDAGMPVIAASIRRWRRSAWRYCSAEGSRSSCARPVASTACAFPRP